MLRGDKQEARIPLFPTRKPRSLAFSWERIKSGAIKHILSSELETGYSVKQASTFMAGFSGPAHYASLLKTTGVPDEVDSRGSERLGNFRPNLCLDFFPAGLQNQVTAQGAGTRPSSRETTTAPHTCPHVVRGGAVLCGRHCPSLQSQHQDPISRRWEARRVPLVRG